MVWDSCLHFCADRSGREPQDRNLQSFEQAYSAEIRGLDLGNSPSELDKVFVPCPNEVSAQQELRLGKPSLRAEFHCAERRRMSIYGPPASIPIRLHGFINLLASYMNDNLAQTRPIEDMPNKVRPRTAPRVAPFAKPFLAGVLFVGLSFVAQAGLPKQDPDFSNYDVPLYEQITNRIKAKVLARLGDGRNTHDRYFIIPFAYENKGNDPGFSHSFMSVIRVLADDKQTKLTPGLQGRTYKNRKFEAFTISWLPHDSRPIPIFAFLRARVVAFFQSGTFVLYLSGETLSSMKRSNWL
jgi:hypothetical protein